MVTPKLTFAESQAEIQAQKNNSDLTNLAHAFEKADATIRELNDHIKKVEELKIEITATAAAIEAGTILPVGEIRKLYDSRLFRVDL